MDYSKLPWNQTTVGLTDQKVYPCDYELGAAILDGRYKIVGVYVATSINPDMILFHDWLVKRYNSQAEQWHGHIAKVVIWDEEKAESFIAWAKEYNVWDDNSEKWYPVSITMGAYDSVTLWHRPVKRIAEKVA